MILLTLDTNTEILSCCLTENETLLSEINIYNSKNHSINSISSIDYVLKNSNKTLNDVDGFVLSKGPGSFTGLRISFSILKAFSFSLNKPMISLSSLDTICYRENFNGIVVSIIDALRDEVYINSFCNKNDIIHNTYEGDIVHIENISDYIFKKHGKNNEILFNGDGVIKHYKFLKENFKNCFINKKPTFSYDYALLGIEKFKLGMFDNKMTNSPSYIRVSQAQEMLIKKQGNKQ